ncbi:MAG: hypothetical protein A3G34_00780 [Candidatus Lindowbacteria bacterium RIFCSPLOWO2_12_FULL_62_27]|nr:MAG: hypothetical protein A3G34_00780 [Candidatus Lindowbacteria bacterium RIFCSPLOWO2_12_FULL_62_27]OGH58157.1 MAG: hypothetical protein A3I06_00765 [Candidatus Lindowbacteria bacterium RIFCSPLOWO2_02_FULL_62_12]
MPAVREWAAYGSVAAGILCAAALIRWMPVVPAHSGLNIPKIVVPARAPVTPEALVVRRDLQPPPSLERRVTPAPRAPRKVIPARVTPVAETPASAPAPVERPAVPVAVPVPVVPVVQPAAPRPTGIQVKVGDADKFRESVGVVVARHSAKVEFSGAAIRIQVPADRRVALKADLDRAIFEHLSDDGVSFQIDLTSP